MSNTTQAEHADHTGTPYTQGGSPFSSTDHKRIGQLYMGASVALFVLSAVLSLAGMEQALAVALLSVAPGVAGAFGNFVMPMQIGARNVAFPGLNQWGLRLYALGALLVVAGGFAGGIAIGNELALSMLGAGGLLVGTSLVLTGVNFIVTIHKLRAPGMTWARIPHFTWCIYASGVAMVTIAPALMVGLIVRTFSPNLLDPAAGGDAALGTALTVYGNPVALVLLLPALGVVSELVTTFSRKTLFGSKLMTHAVIDLAVIGFFAWGHHAFASGQSLYAGTVFGFLSVLAMGPLAVVIIGWLYTLHHGSIELSTPLLFGLGFIVLLTLGTFSGLYLASPATAAYLHDTPMVVGWFDSFVVGASAMALFGGAHYWWPKFTGRSAESGLGKLSAVVLFVGLLMAFDGRFFMGVRGVSREAADLGQVTGSASQIAMAGLGLVVVGAVLATLNLMKSKSSGAPAEANPWGGRTLEWTTQSPPTTSNFNQPPTVVEGPYEYPTQGGSAHAEAH